MDAGPEAGPVPRALSWEECGTLTLDPDPAQPKRKVTGLAVSPDGRLLVGLAMVRGHAWRLADKLEDSTYAWPVETGNEMYAEFSPDGSLVAISGDGPALIDAASGEEVFSPALPPAQAPVLDGAGAYMAFFDFSLDGRRVAGSDYEYAVEVLDTTTHERLATLPSGGLNTGAAFSPDGAFVATGVPELYRTSDWTRVWPPTVTHEGPLDPTNAPGIYPLDNVVFMPDGKRLVVSKCITDSAGRQRCENDLFSVADGRHAGSAPVSGSRPAFSPDGTMLIGGGDVWTPRLGQVRHLGDFPTGVFSSDEELYVGTSDGLVKRFCAVASP
jgi:WD40 repeat protein